MSNGLLAQLLCATHFISAPSTRLRQPQRTSSTTLVHGILMGQTIPPLCTLVPGCACKFSLLPEVVRGHNLAWSCRDDHASLDRGDRNRPISVTGPTCVVLDAASCLVCQGSANVLRVKLRVSTPRLRSTHFTSIGCRQIDTTFSGAICVL